MKKLTKKIQAFEPKTFKVGQFLLATCLKTGKTYQSIISFLDHQTIEASYFNEEKTELGYEGKEETITIELHKMDKWKIKIINEQGELETPKVTIVQKEVFCLDAGDYIILHHKEKNQDICGMIGYATESKIKLCYVVGEYYDAYVEEVTISLEDADKWEMELLSKQPFINRKIKENSIF